MPFLPNLHEGLLQKKVCPKCFACMSCFLMRMREYDVLQIKNINIYSTTSMIHLIQYTLVNYVQLAGKWIRIEDAFSIGNGDIPLLLLMEEILHQLIGSLSHYLQGFIQPRWLFGISSINSMLA